MNDVRSLLRLREDLHSLLVKKASRNLIHFARFMYPKYEAEWFHYLIADHIERAYAGKITRLMVFIHPRAGKSLLCSKLGPAFYLGAYPGKTMICSTYGLDLSSEMGREARKYVKDSSYAEVFPGTFLSLDAKSKTDWKIVHPERYESLYYATSVGGAVTGKGAHVLLIDDPIKGREKCMNEEERNRAWNWYVSDAKTRLEEFDSSVVVIQTRWHEDDLSGRLLLQDEGWTILKLSAVAEQDEEFTLTNPDYIEELGTDKVGREAGEPLYPKKYPLERYLSIQRDDPVFYEALYQQNPSVEEGTQFKRDKMHLVELSQVPEPILTVQSWDTSQTTNAQSDFSACATLAYDGASIYVMDVFLKKMLYHELKQTAMDMFDRDGPDFVLVELRSNGIELVNDLTQTRLPVEGVHVNNESKKFRAISVSSAFHSGGVKIVRGEFTKALVTSLAKFPNAKHDDDVDAVVQGVRWIYNKLARSYFTRALSSANKTGPLKPPPEWPVVRALHIPSDGGPFCVLWMTTVQQHALYNQLWVPGTLIVFCELYGEDVDWLGKNRGVAFSANSLVQTIFEVENSWGLVPDFTYANPSLWNPIQSAQGLANALFEEGMPLIQGVSSETVGLPLVSSLLTQKKLVITETCRNVWRTIPFLEKDDARTYVLTKGQETGPVHALMLAASAALKGSSHDRPIDPQTEAQQRDAARYRSIFEE